MNSNFAIELTDDAAQLVAGGTGGRVVFDIVKSDVSYVNSLFKSISIGIAVGNTADAEAKAKAVGPGSFSQTLTAAQTAPGISESYSGSKAVTNGYYPE